MKLSFLLLSFNINDTIVVMQSQTQSAPDPKEYGKIFTASQLKFIEELPKHKTKAAACKAVGINTNTVHVWTKRNEQFKVVYQDLINRIEQLDYSFDEDVYMREHVIPNSLLRIGEVVEQVITPDMSIQRQKLIVDTALKVAQGRGYLAPEGAVIVQISELAAEAIRANTEYKPPWMTEFSQGRELPAGDSQLDEDNQPANSDSEYRISESYSIAHPMDDVAPIEVPASDEPVLPE